MQGMLKPVTVAIPCFNGERYLGESLRSVLSQTYPAIEVVVFDDGSSDRSAEIARGFGDPRLTVRRNPLRMGIGANWNQGLRYGVGPYVIIHHQDDRMAPDSIERKVAFLEANPSAGLVYSRVEIIDAGGKKWPTQREWFSNDLFDSDRLFEPLPFFMALLLGKNLICCPSVLFRREAALAIGGFNEEMEFTLDWELWLRMAAAFPVGYVDAVTLSYRCHKGMETARHLDRLPEHSSDARRTAVERSADRVNRWPTKDVLCEMISIIRQIEERSSDPRGLGSVMPGEAESPDFVEREPRLRQLLGEIRHPKDQAARLCREVLRLDRECAALRRQVREFEETATFKLGRIMMTPVRLARLLGARWRRR